MSINVKSTSVNMELNSNQPGSKHRGALMAVGGFVVGASAMAAIGGLHGVLEHGESEFLPGSNPSAESSAPFLLQDDRFAVSRPTTTVRNNSSQVDVNDERKMLSERGIRLKLFWEQGYYWQESSSEKWWCLSCPITSVCRYNDKMQLRKCRKKKPSDTTFVVSNQSSIGNGGHEGHQFRVANTDLCLQKMGVRSKAIKLKQCKRNKASQLFVGFNADSKFDLTPSEFKDRCLTNHHHPKSGEEVYAETCEKAHRHTTGFWVAY